MPKCVTIGNVKGGVGKSTTSVQLSLHAGARGLRTLLVDADHGRSSLSWSARAGDAWPNDMVPAVPHPAPDLPRRLPGLAQGFDLIVVDTPHDPSGGTEVGPMLASGIAVADLVIVPTSPYPADLDRLVDLLAAIQAEQNRRDLRWCLALVRVDLRRRQQALEVQEELIERGLPVLAEMVPERAAVKDAFGTATPLLEYKPFVDAVLAELEKEEN